MPQLNKSIHWLYFFIQPLFTLIHYLVNFRNPATKNIMWAFTVYFSMTIAIGQESQGSDINDYMEDVTLMSRADFNWDSLISYYKDSGEVDVFRIFFSFFVSKFTSNGYILLICFGLIYGFFYSRNMWFILERVQGKLKPVSILLLFCLFLIVPIWDLGGFRFWTATHVFLFGLLPYLFNGKKKSLFWCFLTPLLLHYAFVVPLLVLIFYIVAGNRLKVYFISFILSMLIGEINMTQFNYFIESYAPSAIVERSSSYRLQEKVEGYRSGGKGSNKVWYARYLNKFLHWPLYAFLILLYWKSRKNIVNKADLLRLLCFTFLFYSFANIFSTIPSGGRYLSVAGLLATSFLVIYIQNNLQEQFITRAVKVAFPILIIFVIVKIRMSWYFFSLMTLIGNPAVALFSIGENTALNDIIKY